MDNYTITEEAGVLKIMISGDFTANVAATVQEKLEGYRDHDVAKVVFDFKEITFLASSGLRVLIFAKKRIKEGMEVDIVNAGANARKILKMSGLIDVFNMIN